LVEYAKEFNLGIDRLDKIQVGGEKIGPPDPKEREEAGTLTNDDS